MAERKKKPVSKSPIKKKVVKKVAKKGVKRAASKITGRRKPTAISLKKPKANPIIEPIVSDWEAKATFNPTAVTHGGEVHIIYRAIGNDDMSRLGYAHSKNGMKVDERHPNAAYVHEFNREPKAGVKKVSYLSGGGWGGGAEDPRLTLLGSEVYLLYTAFNGWDSVRIALTRITLDDFLNKNFGSWEKPVFISPPGEIHKNWALFPDKIGGKYAILHSISPEIMIDYFDDLDELDGETYIKSVHQGSLHWQRRDKGVRGVGPSPLKTDFGWLVLYHATEEADPGRYKLWAMLLDADNPERVIARSSKPILEPDEDYENDGYKWGVVYSCGAVIKEGNLIVYYGGADKVSCVASADLNAFLSELLKSGGRLSSRKKIKV